MMDQEPKKPVGIRDLPPGEYERAKKRIRKQVDLSWWQRLWNDLSLILRQR